MTDTPPERGRKKVRRGEGEVTQWPRSLVDYTPRGADDPSPSADEDRDLNRLRLAVRLASAARARGRPVESALDRLRGAERAFRAGARSEGRRLVNEAMDALELDSHAP